MPHPGQAPQPAAQALVLAFTRGVSLRMWAEGGGLAREWALYERLTGVYSLIVLVTWGDDQDHAVLRTLSRPGKTELVLIPNSGALPEAEFARSVAAQVVLALGASKSVVAKTNQHDDGGVAAAVAEACREAGLRVGIVGRGGFPLFRFAEWQHGQSSRAALDADRREGRLCRAADVVVGTTREMLDDLGARHGLTPDRLKLIPNYIVPSDTAPIPRDTREVLCAGRLVPQKRFDLLLRALAMMNDPGARATIVGEGPERRSLETLARDLKVNASFIGRIGHDELLARMSRCAVYCQPSAYEGHPKTVLEAMSTAAPVVVADSPGLREVVRDGETGITVPLDHKPLAEAITQLLRNPAAAAALGERARAVVRERCSLDRILKLEVEAHNAALELADRRPSREPASVV